VADDEAFCFMYRESLEAFEKAGAELVHFSPVADAALPEGVSGLYLPGGYPELHGRALAANEAMKASILAAAKKGMPIVAECGGFMYLQESLQDMDGADCAMTGLLRGNSEKKDRLVRFGYAQMTAEKDSLLLRKGETFPIHEFHYWDTTNNGTDCSAVKPVSGRSWQCAITGPALFAGFPHLYFAAHPVLAERFVAAAAAYDCGTEQASETPEGGRA
jgi:cobyrinic acid a,c-diamide synthase